MQKFTNKPVKHCVQAVRDTVTTRLLKHMHLQFVYDIVQCETPFQLLKYVLDAARQPLCNTPRFEDVYGLPRFLLFKRAEPRVSRPDNWWASIYE